MKLLAEKFFSKDKAKNFHLVSFFFFKKSDPINDWKILNEWVSIRIIQNISEN